MCKFDTFALPIYVRREHQLRETLHVHAYLSEDLLVQYRKRNNRSMSCPDFSVILMDTDAHLVEQQCSFSYGLNLFYDRLILILQLDIKFVVIRYHDDSLPIRRSTGKEDV